MLAHLFQSTLFAAAAWLLVLSMRRNRAGTRYAIWLTASLKFLVPFALLISAGSHIGWRAAPPSAKWVEPMIIESAIESTIAPILRSSASPREISAPMEPIVLTIWFMGCVLVFARRARELRRVSAIVRAAKPFPLPELPIAVHTSGESLEPGVFGILRPVLLLPANLADRLTEAQLDAILAHELAHIRRRDNLTAALHMLVEAVFWFHPLVWWIGARLVEERERACDEAVIESGNEPGAYAEGILSVCRLYLKSPSLCVAGVTGSNLRKRIEQIMTHHAGQNLRIGKKSLLAFAALAALGVPLLIGIFSASRIQAQAQLQASDGSPAFAVVSVKPNTSGEERMDISSTAGGRLTARNIPVSWLIRFAFKAHSNPISGAPNWLGSARFDVIARADDNTASQDQVRLMARRLLAERFNLRLHTEYREQPIYTLVTGKNGIGGGPDLHVANACTPATSGPRSEADPPPCGAFRLSNGGQLWGFSVTMETLSTVLSDLTGRIVRDRTGLSGNFELRLAWTPDQSTPGAPAGSGQPPADLGGPSIFTALQEQLGLQLKAERGPVEVLVIDHVDKPSAN